MNEQVIDRYREGVLLWRPHTGAVVRVHGDGRREIIVRFAMCSPELAALLVNDVTGHVRRAAIEAGAPLGDPAEKGAKR